MRVRKLFARAAMLGIMGGTMGTALAFGGEQPVDVQELVKRLEAAEAEIKTLKSQSPRQGPSTFLYAPSELTEVQPAGVQGAPASELATRVSDLEKKWQSHEDSEAKKKSAFPTVKVIGRVHADSVWAGQDDENMAAVGDIDDGSDFRRARIGVEGLLWENLDYRLEVDFAGSGRPSFTDVYATALELPCVGNVRMGHFKEPICLEFLTSSRFMTFMERSTMHDAFNPQRNMGIMSQNHSEDDTMTWAIGWFRTGSDEFGDDVGDEGEQAVTARVTLNPYYDEGSGGRYLVHVGGAYSFRDADEDVVRFASTPEMRMRTSSTGIGGSGEGSLPNFVDTGTFEADNHQLLAAELAVVWGSLSVQSEYMASVVDSEVADDPTFHGVYVFASYFLTGEHRPYNRKWGYFERVKPHENFFSVCTDEGPCCGWGAWELKARWSYIDLDDEAIEGGELHDVTLGVNWYWNPNFKIMFDYVHAELDRAGVDSDADFVGMRAAFDW